MFPQKLSCLAICCLSWIFACYLLRHLFTICLDICLDICYLDIWGLFAKVKVSCEKNRSTPPLLLINNYPALDIIEPNSWFETWTWNLGNLQPEIKVNLPPVKTPAANYSTLFIKLFLQIRSCQRDKKDDAKISRNNCDTILFCKKWVLTAVGREWNSEITVSVTGT